MKCLSVLLLSVLLSMAAAGQNLQLYYDMRHWVDPRHTPSGFPGFFFEYFKLQDSGKGLVKPGSFLFKMQGDLQGRNNNPGKVYFQATQTFRCWRPPVFLSVQYSGGLGVTEPKEYSYYIANSFSVGIAWPFQWKGAWFNASLSWMLVTLRKPSHDLLFSFYWGRGIRHYKMEVAGDFSIYSQNRNTGESYALAMTGKRWSFFAEPQFWFNLGHGFSAGTRVNIYYHVLSTDERVQVYPAPAVKLKF